MEKGKRLNIGKIKAVDYVLSFQGLLVFRYICVVQNVRDPLKDIEVMSMKVTNDEKTVFRVCEDDISSIPKTSVLGKLPAPDILATGDRLKYQFPKPVDVFEAS